MAFLYVFSVLFFTTELVLFFSLWQNATLDVYNFVLYRYITFLKLALKVLCRTMLYVLV